MLKTDRQYELLAPAKNKEIAKLAISCGADAVYIGYSKFGARSAAGNTLADIKEVVEFAHMFRAKVYITLNTIFKDEELVLVLELIKKLYSLDVDGIIIQDMGLLELDLPPIPIIASTQCHNNTLEKIKFLQDTGFKRVILPRETSLKEIEYISKNTDVEVESFVHGALCVAYSGQCYMSYSIGGRSANRGECAQPCRKKYSLKDSTGKFIVKNKYLLSLKDFNLSNNIEELILAGVSSFKIEGRLKDEAYIKNVVSFYRREIDKVLVKYNLQRSSVGDSSISFEPDLSKTFNRSYTTYFLKGRSSDISAINYSKSLGEEIGLVSAITKTGFEIRTNKQLSPGDGICFFDKNDELVGTKINEVRENMVFPNTMDSISKGILIYRNYNRQFEKSLAQGCNRKISIVITVDCVEDEYLFKAVDSQNNFVEIKVSNSFEVAKDKIRAHENIKKQLAKLGDTEFFASDIKITADHVPFIPIQTINSIRRELVLELRFMRTKNFKKSIRDKDLQVVKYPYTDLDYLANVYNEKAKQFYETRGAAVTEYAAEKNNKFNNKKIMITKHCIKYLLNMCSKANKNNDTCKEPLFLVDEFGKEYQLSFDCKSCEMQIYS